MARWASMAAFACALAIPGVVASPYADVRFETVIVDPEDNQGFLDIREVAVGEPGNGTVVFRYNVTDFEDSPEVGARNFLSFNVLIGDHGSNVCCHEHAPGFDQDGRPVHLGNDPLPPTSCLRDGNAVYCSLSYVDFHAQPGKELRGLMGTSYASVVLQDCAPNPYPYTPCFSYMEITPAQPSYTLRGCTAHAGCPTALDPVNPVQDVATQRLEVDSWFGAPRTGSYLLNWTNGAHAAALAFNTSGDGDVAYVVEDAAGNVLGTGSASLGNGTATLDAAAGVLTVRLTLSAFRGHVRFVLDPIPASETSTVASPMAGVPLALFLLGVAGARHRAVRRRDHVAHQGPPGPP